MTCHEVEHIHGSQRLNFNGLWTATNSKQNKATFMDYLIYLISFVNSRRKSITFFSRSLLFKTKKNLYLKSQREIRRKWFVLRVNYPFSQQFSSLVLYFSITHLQMCCKILTISRKRGRIRSNHMYFIFLSQFYHLHRHPFLYLGHQ